MMNTPLPGTAPCPGSTSTAACGANGQLSSGIGINASIGYGNYNGAYFTVKTNNWHGLTTQQNFTWSKSLGTGALVQATSQYTADDPFNLGTMYGLQSFDRKFVYNVFVVWQPNRWKSQQGMVGHLLGGWTFAPIFTAGSGEPMPVFTANGESEAFGAGDASNFFDNENAIKTTSIAGGSSSAHYGVKGQTAGTSGFGLNVFKDPDAAFAAFRQPILGLDTNDGGYGVLRGMPYWNMDLSIRKRINITERVNFEFQTVFTNVLNHVQFQDPSGYFGLANMDTSAPATFGVIPGQGNTPRQMEFGLRLSW
jgi:hypothetical protein